LRRRKDSGTLAEDLLEIFVAESAVSFLEGGEKKGNNQAKLGKKYAKKHWRSTLLDILLPDFSYLNFSNDLWIFPILFSTVGFNESLSIHVNPRYLNSVTNSIFPPFIVTLTKGLLT
jgi:hypothetical protein